MKAFHRTSSKRRLPLLFFALIATYCALPQMQAQDGQNHLANVTVLIVRHAEKPAKGANLTPEGVARAERYAHYFSPFVTGETSIKINALYSGADSADSIRPRLTLEPLSRATGLPLNTQFSTKEPQALALALVKEQHGDHVLICWRHGKIPALLTALGADPAKLLPDGVWPDEVYDWVVFLHFDATGHLDQQRLIHEPNPLP